MNIEPPKHILIAEDDTAVRESLERALRLEGYAVTTSENGQKALDLAAVNQPDLYLLDVMMPVLDGLSGLTIGTEYYVKGDGTLGTTGTFKVGRAIATDKIYITNAR